MGGSRDLLHRPRIEPVVVIRNVHLLLAQDLEIVAIRPPEEDVIFVQVLIARCIRVRRVIGQRWTFADPVLAGKDAPGREFVTLRIDRLPGKIALARLDKTTQKTETIAEVHPGEFFGEMALLEEMPRTATASALEDTKVFMLFKIKLDSLLFARPRIGVTIAAQLAKILSARLRAILEQPADQV